MRIEQIGFQGDIMVRRVAAVPQGMRVESASGEHHVIAHSETGHHHVMDATGAVRWVSEDPSVCYLVLERADVQIEHLRGWDTHASLLLGGGVGAVWEVRRQREWTPEGERMAVD